MNIIDVYRRVNITYSNIYVKCIVKEKKIYFFAEIIGFMFVFLYHPQCSSGSISISVSIVAEIEGNSNFGPWTHLDMILKLLFDIQ